MKTPEERVESVRRRLTVRDAACAFVYRPATLRLLLTMNAADAAIAKFARDADHARALRAVKLAKIRQACRASAAVAIAEWHADEIEAEIARVMSAGCERSRGSIASNSRT